MCVTGNSLGRCCILPIHAPGKEAQALVATGATEDHTERGTVRSGEAEDAETCQDWHDPFGDDFWVSGQRTEFA